MKEVEDIAASAVTGSISGRNSGRSCPPCFRFPRRLLPLGFFGLTRSLDGGLDEFDEFFFASANSASNSEIRSSNGAVALATAASISSSTSLRVKVLAMRMSYPNHSNRPISVVKHANDHRFHPCSVRVQSVAILLP